MATQQQLPVSPILRRDLSALALEGEAESDANSKSQSPKPKFAARASSPALPQASVQPGGPSRTGSILKKPGQGQEGAPSPALGGANWTGSEGEQQPSQQQPAQPAAGLGLDSLPASALSPASPAGPGQPSARTASPLPGAWAAAPESKKDALSALSTSSTPLGSAVNSRSTSPHCHFAPLPKVDQDRPGTRRNSFAQGVRSKILALSGEMTDEPYAIDTDDAPTPDLSKPSLAQGTPRPVHADGLERYPKTRRSSSGRSTSPSPSRRPTSSLSGTTSGGSTSSAPTSRSHSPAMSRHASGDALHLHYIQAEKPKKERSASQSRDASSAGEALPVLALSPHGKQSREDSNVTLKSPASVSPSRMPTSPNLGEVGSAFVSTATAVAPVPAGKRMTSFVDPSPAELQRDRSPSITNRCKPSNHDVVALDPSAGAEEDEQLEEVEEEDEEAEEDGSENDDEDEGDEDDEEDENVEEEDEDEDEEDEEEAEGLRASTVAGGVEVVHWRKEEAEEE